MKPQRIQLSRRKGWRMPPNTIKVDRSTKWGNPFIVGKHGTRAECVAFYRCLAAGQICISLGADLHEPQVSARFWMERASKHLRGKNLACWCPLSAPCHADVLIEIANS